MIYISRGGGFIRRFYSELVPVVASDFGWIVFRSKPFHLDDVTENHLNIYVSVTSSEIKQDLQENTNLFYILLFCTKLPRLLTFKLICRAFSFLCSLWSARFNYYAIHIFAVKGFLDLNLWHHALNLPQSYPHLWSLALTFGQPMYRSQQEHHGVVSKKICH